MSDSYQKTEAEAVAQIVRDATLPLNQTTPTVPVLVWPKSEKVESLERFQTNPVRKRASVTVQDYQSFIQYLLTYREPGTTIFAELTEAGGRFVALIDYHHPNPSGGATIDGIARWAQHRCTLEMKHTPEWQRWAAKDDVAMEQTAFALFLEDNRLDILEPVAAQVIDIAKSIEAESGSRFKSATRLDNGDRKLLFETETNARAGTTGELTIPEKFKLRLPVFVNGPVYDLEAFFRYQVGNPLKLRYKLIRPNKVIELALLEARNAIQTALSLPVLAGSCHVPEVK